MKAMMIEKFGDLDQIKLGEIPIPEPQPNEVQIQIAYAGINPVDWKICEGLLRERMPYEFPIVLGWDVAGIITKIGKQVSRLKIGDEVFAYARKSKIKDGTLAEYICLEADHVAFRPEKIGLREAAAIPLTGLTSWQSLFDSANLKTNESILIHAGAGGIGSMAIQFAKQQGAKIFTTANQQNHAYVKKLGADVAIDYKQEDFVAKIKSILPSGVDVVFDTIGGSTLEKSLDVIKPGGRLVSLLQQLPADIAEKRHIIATYVFVHPNGSQLKTIAELIDAGKVVPPHLKEYPFNQTQEAFAELKTGHVQGKIVIKI